MGLPVVNAAYYPTPEELRSQMLAELRWLYHRRGITVNVAEGSEPYKRHTVLANRGSIALANGQLALADASPSAAQGQALLDQAARVGITPRPASKATGYLIVGVGGPAHQHVTIPNGWRWTPPGGMTCETTGAFTVENGETVEVRAITAGEDGNCDPDTIGTWDDAAVALLQPNATVDSAGISGGHESDDVEEVRRRLLRKLRAPAVGGNPASVVDWAEESSAAVNAAFVYRAIRGPASIDVAVMQQDTSSVLSLTVINGAAANIAANLPGGESLNVTTVFEQTVDICIDAKLPLPKNAGGAGGGWRDAVPWPTDADAANTFCEVLSVISPNQIVVNSTAADPPQAGKHIAVWNPMGGPEGDGAMMDFAILTVAGVGPPHYTLTLDCTTNAISFVSAGMLVSAAADNLTAYARAFHDAMAELGPGEKTGNVDLLPLSLRFPGPDVELPSDLTSLLLDAVSAQFAEVKDLAYAATYAAGTGESGTSTWVDRSSPSLPATTAQAPRILKLGALSFRRKM